MCATETSIEPAPLHTRSYITEFTIVPALQEGIMSLTASFSAAAPQHRPKMPTGVTARLRRWLLSSVSGLAARLPVPAGMLTILVSGLSIAISPTYATSNNWTRDAGTDDWSTAENWENGVPTSDHFFVYIDNANGPVLSGPDVSVSAVSVLIANANATSGSLEIRDGAVLTLASSLPLDSLIGAGSDSTGSVLVTGQDSAWNILQAGLNLGARGSGELTVADGASLSMQTISMGTLGGSGVLNIGAASGEAQTGAGTVNAGSIRFGRGTGTLVFNHTALFEDSYEFSANMNSDISNPGTSIIKHENGVTRLTGDGSAFEGTTDVTGGTLLVNNALGGVFNVSGGGILGGTGRIGTSGLDTTIGSGSTLSSGEGGIGELNIAGNLVFESGSTYAVDVGTNGNSDKVVVAGTATIEPGAELSIASVDGVDFEQGWTYTILQSAGLTGTFDTETVVGDFAAFTVGYNSLTNSVTLTIGNVTSPPTEITDEWSPGGIGIIDTEYVGDDVIFKNTSTYAVDIAENGRSDRLVVTGRVDIESGAGISIMPVAGVDFEQGWTYTVIKATELNGEFSPVSGDFATFSVENRDNNVVLTIDRLLSDVTGTLSPGGRGNIETETRNHDTVFTSGTVYVVDVGENGDSDNVVINGKLTIEPDVSLSISPMAGVSFEDGWQYTILEFDSRTGGFNDTIVNGEFAEFSVKYNSSNVQLTLDRVNAPAGTDFSINAETPNQGAVARAINTIGRTTKLYNALFLVEKGESADALEQLSGDINASTQAVLSQDTSFVRDAIGNRIRSASDNAMGSATKIQVLGYASQTMPESPAGLARTDGDDLPGDAERLTFWTSAFGAWGRDDGNNGQTLDRSVGGALIGTDTTLLHNWRVGAFGGYSHSSFDTSSSDGGSNNFDVGAYAGSEWGALSMRSGLAYTWHDISTYRNVAFNLITNAAFAEQLRADYSASTLQAFSELGYRIDMYNVSFEPFTGLSHVHARSDGFTETGGVAALTVDSTRFGTTHTKLGLRAAAAFDLYGRTATATGTLGWQHAFGDIDPFVTQSFSTGDAFTVAGVPIDRNVAVVEGGLDFQMSPTALLGVSYNGRFGANGHENGFNTRIKMRF